MRRTLRVELLNRLRWWIEIEFVRQFCETPFHRSDQPLSLHPGCHDLSQRLFQVFKGDILVFIHRGDISNAAHPHHGREVFEKQPCFLCCLSAHIGSFKLRSVRWCGSSPFPFPEFHCEFPSDLAAAGLGAPYWLVWGSLGTALHLAVQFNRIGVIYFFAAFDGIGQTWYRAAHQRRRTHWIRPLRSSGPESYGCWKGTYSRNSSASKASCF